MGFITTLFSVSYVMNGACARSAFASVRGSTEKAIAAVTRTPAMMRLNSRVHGPQFTSPLEAALIDGSGAIANVHAKIRELSLGLVSRVDDFSRGIDLRGVDRVREIAPDYSLIIPSSLNPVSDIGGVSAQILDHSVTAFFNRSEIKNSFVGRAAETVEKKMKAEVAIGGEEPDSIQHNIKFQMKASETKASMEYRGLTNADLSYSIGSRKTNFEVFEKITDGSNLVYTHSDEPSDRRDMLSLRMHW